MKRHSAGFGLLELMVALTLGLIILLGVSQVFLVARTTYMAQNASAAMQEDARYALSRMVQEIRMVGMFGYISPTLPLPLDFATPYANPISYVATTVGTVTTGVLTLITADVGANGSTPNWTILTDPVKNTATVYDGAQAATGMMAMPIRQVIYTYDSTNQRLLTTLAGTQSVLISNVTAMSVLFGMCSSGGTAVTSYTATVTAATWANICSVRIS